MKLGAKVIRADEIGHRILRDERVKNALVERFGAKILKDGEIDREELGGVVFGNKEAMGFLNRLTHPRINEMIKKDMEKLDGVIVVEAAILFEMGLEGICDFIVATYCPEEEQMRRLLQKGLSRGEAKARLSSQMPPEYYASRSDVVIFTAKALEETAKRAEEVYKILSRGGKLELSEKQS